MLILFAYCKTVALSKFSYITFTITSDQVGKINCSGGQLLIITAILNGVWACPPEL